MPNNIEKLAEYLITAMRNQAVYEKLKESGQLGAYKNDINIFLLMILEKYQYDMKAPAVYILKERILEKIKKIYLHEQEISLPYRLPQEEVDEIDEILATSLGLSSPEALNILQSRMITLILSSKLEKKENLSSLSAKRNKIKMKN